MSHNSDENGHPPVIRFCGKTDVGKKRASNQDSIYVPEPGGHFFILADGMGGHLGGEEASGIATDVGRQVFEEVIVRTETEPFNIDATAQPSYAARLTRSAILEADRKIVQTSEQRSDLRGMGATVETLYFSDGNVTIGHVGDSRVYRLRDGTLEQITEDHSILNEELKRRKMTPEEIRNFPFKNRIMRALGHLVDGRIDVLEEPAKPGDVYLMCSDGLTDVVADSIIEQVVRDNSDDVKACCAKLVSLANEGGGPDNISVIVVVVDQ